ncbi:MAG TPA: hypothetical protein VM943_04180, partial [Pyrinomonadaceae bacterium]|nr:hypothetical protein [Pyrinomonadaceae bacterium]
MPFVKAHQSLWGKWGNGEKGKMVRRKHAPSLQLRFLFSISPLPHFPTSPKVLFQVAELMLEQRDDDDGRR